MLCNKGFDLWADTYDESVDISDKNNIYPFAGYEKLINVVVEIILNNSKKSTILDIGIGTGALSYELYKNDYKITGIDFSEKMIKICKEKMPLAKMIQYDFSKGLPDEINREKYDYIISTYAFHHLDDNEKIILIKKLLGKLNKNGLLIIGDVSFHTRNQLNECKLLNKDGWDDDEFYIVYDEIKDNLESIYKIEFIKISICAVIITISMNEK
jgi:putative AdoMet-dependent methyltransferase